MADAAVTFLLEKLFQLGQAEIELIAGDKDALNQLQDKLRRLKSFLQDADKMQKKDASFKETESQIRDVIHIVEDTIDTCLTQIATAKSRNSFRQTFSRTNRLSLAHEVKSLTDKKVEPMLVRVEKELAEMRSARGSTTGVEQSWTNLKKVEAFKRENIVGFEDEEETLTNYLMEEKETLDVISIIGMPGLGKTTLAWKIYESPKIKYGFGMRIWVTVSQTLSKKDVFLKILKNFEGQNLSGVDDEEELIERVKGHLKAAKFLLVLDDVWSVEAWNAIQVVLPFRNELSKVLITSRYTAVGKHANRSRPEPHQLRFLRPEESWELLQLEAFGKRDGIQIDRDLERIGKSIAKKCDGLPLAIVVIGGVLGDKYSIGKPTAAVVKDWTEVFNNIKNYLIKNEQGDNVEGISNIIALSYGTLPDKLKDCFLYLGMFPEDYLIPAWKLTRLWIAEGFTQAAPGQNLEKAAEENLNDLIARNLVRVKERNPHGEVKKCTVHDVIRAFCISRAKDQKLFQEMTLSLSNGVFDPPVSTTQDYRRLCIHSDVQDFLFKRPKGPRVRTILSYNNPPINLESKHSTYLSDTFKLLKVLDSISINFKILPDGFARLIHLRYITLRINDLKVLPESFTKLWNLQTLVVHTSSGTLSVEVNMWKMIQLRHIKSNAAMVLCKAGGEGGENLQTLTTLSPECCTEDVFNKAKNLKRLGIRGKLDTLSDANTNSIKKLDALENLKLVNERYHGSVPRDRVRSFPDGNWFPKKLRRLILSATLLDWKYMSILGKVDTLEVLKLKDNAFTGSSWDVVRSDCFKNLHYLFIKDTDLEYWEVDSTECFPKLRSLFVHNCRKLEKIPLGLAEQLEILDIENLGESAVKSALKIDEVKKEQLKAKMSRDFKLNVGPGCKH